LSKLPNIIEPTGVHDQTTYANLFYTKPEWLSDVIFFENKTYWGYVIGIVEVEIGQGSRTFHIEEWWIV
jgi:hypothetical protein